MDKIKQKLRNRRLFLKRDAMLAKRLKNDYIDNGIASLPCKVTGLDDVISRFSVPGYETLSPEFSEYIESAAAFVPPEYPIVLEISGCRFSEEEQTIIRRTIREDYTYELGAVQWENRKQMIVALLMLVGMVITGFLAFGVQGIADGDGKLRNLWLLPRRRTWQVSIFTTTCQGHAASRWLLRRFSTLFYLWLGKSWNL